MQNGQRNLAIIVAVMLSFAAGLIFSSFFGPSSSFVSEAAPPVCSGQSDVTRCAALVSADATVRIAAWTRIDALFSLATGAAAVFAFLAYLEGRGARVAAQEQAATQQAALVHSRAIAAEQLLTEKRRSRANIQLTDLSVSLRGDSLIFDPDSGETTATGTFAIECGISLSNIGLSEARDLHAKLDLNVGQELADSSVFDAYAVRRHIQALHLPGDNHSLGIALQYEPRITWESFRDLNRGPVKVELVIDWLDGFDDHHSTRYIAQQVLPTRPVTTHVVFSQVQLERT